MSFSQKFSSDLSLTSAADNLSHFLMKWGNGHLKTLHRLLIASSRLHGHQLCKFPEWSPQLLTAGSRLDPAACYSKLLHPPHHLLHEQASALNMSICTFCTSAQPHVWNINALHVRDPKLSAAQKHNNIPHRWTLHTTVCLKTPTSPTLSENIGLFSEQTQLFQPRGAFHPSKIAIIKPRILILT